MGKINQKLLKIQLISLFLITVFSFLAFYYRESLPDHHYAISSGGGELGLISYYVTSMMTLIAYYTGPWVLFPFMIFAVFYAFQYSQRDYVTDFLNILPLLGLFMLQIFIFFPSLLGNGVTYALEQSLEMFHVWILSFLMATLFIAASFRDRFVESLKRFGIFLKNLPMLLIRGIGNLSPLSFMDKLGNLGSRFRTNVQMRTQNLIKGDSDYTDSSNVEDHLQYESPEYLEEVEEAESEIKEEAPKQLSSSFLSGKVESVAKKILPKKGLVKAQRTSAAKNESQYYDIVAGMTSNKSNAKNVHPDDKYFNDIIERIEDKLAEFRIDGNIINILKGPVVDTFELELGSGVKVSKVTRASEDLSMALYGAPIRIVYPMLGRTTVGIEVPRNPREIIFLDEILNSKEFKDTKHTLPLAMGKDAFGETFVTDLAGMPHMLVAGATGAGKSVFINSILVSLLVKKSPRQMKLILVDPKQLELALYSKLPHLIMPVITDAKVASVSLLWAIQEMERRYSIMKEFGVRNLDGFRAKLLKADSEMIARIHQYYENEPKGDYELPNIVIIIDEFADLILTKAGKEIENTICRLAAKARASGIHLILATQRPSVDVITGLIKSNFPTRVSFRVTSSVDSRTILNSIGAEKLLGKGDMLYKHGTNSSRVHAPFVEEDEIEILTEKLAEMPSEYDPAVLDFLENGGDEEKSAYSFGSHIPSAGGETAGGSDHALFKQAVATVIEYRTASASMLQRRLRIGYNRAANLIEEMEARGVVGPAEGSKRRQVLISSPEEV
ncbi:MAG: hypothetical protein HN509_05460 [Halobacteriovoraceae bacterium]|jgi:DNA segregation ATPase FtsK/SpoIIIE, S-DNA-T family|nr:hypothetical protein [Halobacteriovoraceae bacterium]MBT5093801.1 hypothetical protein [Halobacteriovoraceae bacterium]